ncbi:MAG: 3-beta hydroxysteroid dehydrogenase [Frankiales bacterium]|nr:3-beta hydroxysteroid dehydrogenase [Frankiales bacterium]
MRVAVAGGTGLAGRYVEACLSAAGHIPVTLARAAGVDITTGKGLDAALSGVPAVIDVSNVTTMRKHDSIAFFEAGTRHLLEAGARADVRHHVILSIVGIDRVDFGYYFGKRAQEELALASGRPVSILRATQFHEFAGQLLDRARGPIAFVPRMLVAPVAAAEVAAALVALVDQAPVGRAPDRGGPQQRELIDLARAVRTARGSKKVLCRVRVPGAAGRAMADGALLPTGNGPRGRQTFDDWLASSALVTR